jgi:hypothetical protein
VSPKFGGDEGMRLTMKSGSFDIKAEKEKSARQMKLFS